MTDYKQLCAELVAWAEKTSAHYYAPPEVLVRAHAALAEPEPTNSISFQEGSEVIRLDAKGFHYHGQFIEDAGEAHRLLVEFLRKHQPDSDWHHAE